MRFHKLVLFIDRARRCRVADKGSLEHRDHYQSNKAKKKVFENIDKPEKPQRCFLRSICDGFFKVFWIEHLDSVISPSRACLSKSILKPTIERSMKSQSWLKLLFGREREAENVDHASTPTRRFFMTWSRPIIIASSFSRNRFYFFSIEHGKSELKWR